MFIANDPDSVRATLSDVAREARVSLATVDRVLNKRPGVHARTVSRVNEAVRRLNYRPDPAAARLARHHPHRIGVVLPSNDNGFVADLRRQLMLNQAWIDDHRVQIDMAEVDVFEPNGLARELLALGGHCETVVVVALDHPVVRSAIDTLAEQGIAVITLVSDVPGSRRRHFVGIDNVAAGRTAATLIARFIGARSGTVGIVLGSASLRDHAERSLGFSQVMAAEYPGLVILPPVEGKDDTDRTRATTEQLLRTHPDIAAIYSIGAGNQGVVDALSVHAAEHKIVFVGHELSPFSREALLTGTMDAVINQDAGHEIRSALRLAVAGLTQEPVHSGQERIRIDIYVKDNLP